MNISAVKLAKIARGARPNEAIAALWNAHGDPPRCGGVWTSSSVSKSLNHPTAQNLLLLMATAVGVDYTLCLQSITLEFLTVPAGRLSGPPTAGEMVVLVTPVQVAPAKVVSVTKEHVKLEGYRSVFSPITGRAIEPLRGNLYFVRTSSLDKELAFQSRGF